MIKELVSIVVPVYNVEDFIGQTIESVLNQTYTQWELILVDDASRDKSVEIIQSYKEKDDRIRLFQLETNSGAAVARNTGIDMAQGQYLAFLDGDDYWLPDKLSHQLSFIKDKGATFTYTGFAYVSQEGQVTKAFEQVPKEMTYQALLKNTAIACSSVIIDHDAIGYFHMPLVRRGQDTATWLMLLRSKVDKAYGLQEVLHHYRKVEGSISSNFMTALKRTWYTYRHIEKLPLHQAVYYFISYATNAALRRL